MSLKTIHFIVMLLSAVLAFSFSAWGFRDFFHGSGNRTHLVLAVLSLAASGVLVYYLYWFLHKLKKSGL